MNTNEAVAFALIPDNWRSEGVRRLAHLDADGVLVFGLGNFHIWAFDIENQCGQVLGVRDVWAFGLESLGTYNTDDWVWQRSEN